MIGVILYLLLLAVVVYVNKGIGDMNHKYDKSIEEAAEQRRRELK